mgnify:CR=1 FL=1
MIDFTKGIFQSDKFLKIFLNGNWCNINEAEYPDAWKQVQAWLAEGHKVQPEPLPPPPTDAQLEAAAEAQRQARFAEYDKAVSKCRRHIDEGDMSRDWAADLSAWHSYAMALEALNDAPGWFRETVWPVKPEV